MAEHPVSGTLARLERWYLAQCNGEWEHTWGVSIQTLDNPGWLVSIDLEQTPLKGCHFEPLRERSSDDDWIACAVKTKDGGDRQFEGAGDGSKLNVILDRFLDWAAVSGADEKS